jgi:arylsulfatase A
MVGKWHNGLYDMRYHPNARGFDEFIGFLNGGMDYYKWVLDNNGSPRSTDGRYLTDVFTDESIRFIQHHRTKPFFLYIAYNTPHAPFQTPEEMIRRYHGRTKLNEKVMTIYAMIERMDFGIGRIIQTLEQLELSHNTIVLITSDNGPAKDGGPRYNGGLRGGKGDVLEGGIRVPAIVRWLDGLPRGTRTNELIHFTDWFPTLLAAAGVQKHKGLPVDGGDVLPILRGKRRPASRPSFWFWQHNRYSPVPHCNAAMRDGKWKLYWPTIPGSMRKDPIDTSDYIQNMSRSHRLRNIDTTLPDRKLPEPKSPLLYDLETDPGERKNLMDKYPERVAFMREQWDAWFNGVMTEYEVARRANVA